MRGGENGMIIQYDIARNKKFEEQEECARNSSKEIR